MNVNALLLIIGSLSLFSLIISTPFTNFAFGQASPTIGNDTSSSTSSLDSSKLVKKLEKVSSLSNIVGISLVDGIKVSGINIGDTDMSVTLRYQAVGGNVSNTGNASASASLPVTIIATKLPVSNLTQLLSMVEAMRNMATTTATNNANPMGSILGQPGSSNAAMESNAVQILSLLRNIQIGIASVVNANWTLPQTVSMGLFGGLRDMGAASSTTTTTAPTDLVVVIVVPFLGETNLPTLQLK
jgi:hypothetical protein